MEYGAKRQVPSSDQNQKTYRPPAEDAKKKLVDMAHRQNCSRKHQLCGFCSTTGKTTLQSDPNRSQSVARRQQKPEIPTTTTCNPRTTMVAREYQHTNPHSLQRPNSVHNHRCIRSRLGSYSERPKYKRYLEQGTTTMAYQLERVMDAENSSRNCNPKISRPNNLSANRQQNSSRLHQQGRGNKIIDTATNDFGYAPGNSSQSNTSHCALSTREVQPVSRQPIQISRDAGMDSIKTDVRNNIQQAGLPNNRPVCKFTVGGRGSVRIGGRTGPSLCIRERFQQALALPTRMDFPSTASHTSNITAPEKEFRTVPISGSKMGENFLENGTEPKSPQPTADNLQPTPTPGGSADRETTTRCRETTFAGMEGSGWAHLVDSWPENDKTLLESAWRKSTLKTYGTAWEKWRAWSKGKCAVDDPAPGHLAMFMSYLHNETKLAPSTIAVHKSVVSTFANPVKSEALSGHPLVKQMMKAISVTKPPPRKSTTWDVGILIEYLQHYNIDVESIFQVSRHTAALLLLCSGRRIHDLTLLDISSEFFEDANDYIILWPKFGSKTDSSTYRQAGWRCGSKHLLVCHKSEEVLGRI
ncbi:uncharacterized protein LOC114356369 [Ostrinia furnacalis]|uniref:uncharacterized protein LOC114356369 n=1 Tax=Ostrinia furnacalis TaxID=93504 RepID=UPI00103CDB81|nr:uncharacterized protein LOC114356369 [Ostrinia furnacalis]